MTEPEKTVEELYAEWDDSRRTTERAEARLKRARVERTEAVLLLMEKEGVDPNKLTELLAERDELRLADKERALATKRAGDMARFRAEAEVITPAATH